MPFPVPLFRLVETMEVEAELGGGELWIRVELFRDVDRPDQYRCRTWKAGAYDLLSPDEVDQDTGERAASTEAVLVPWQLPGGMVTDEPFYASSKEAAVEAILADLDAALTRLKLLSQAEEASLDPAGPSLWPPKGG